jgi:endonuclease/exonuclease/phosphatase family metal-dependent hydrolase
MGDLCLINAHFPREEKGRLAMAANLHECLPSDKSYRVIIAGDFNSFPNCKGPEQIETIRKVTETNRISDLALSEISKEIATHSFKPYPYDFVPPEALEMPGKLKHIFVKGFRITDETTPLVLDVTKMKGWDFTPSDHYPIKATLTFE